METVFNSLKSKMDFKSKKEQALWLTTFIVVVGIYSTLGLAGKIGTYFNEQGFFAILFITGIT